jgi:4-diphosphocytidyl-2-C-methyl-D-erythritol kinase
MDLDGPSSCKIVSTGIFYKIALDKTNTMARAVDIIRKLTGFDGSININIHKEIPPYSGLGGGSSNGTHVFLSLLRTLGHSMAKTEILKHLAKIGSDCPFFSKNTPQLVSGRGEILTDLGKSYVAKIRNLKFAVFKPKFDINTAWAYAQMANGYTDEAKANELLAKFLHNLEMGKHSPIYNDFNSLVFERHLELKNLKKTLADRGFYMSLTGSGSACLVHLNSHADWHSISALIKAKLGQDIFIRSVTCM